MHQLMKAVLHLLVFSFALAACQYKVPLTEEHEIPVDPLVLGSWKIVPAPGQDNDSAILILKFSDTEYSVRYHEDGGNLYFRAYGINIDGIAAIQLELIGNDDGAVNADEYDRYHVIAYHLDKDLLKISTLNTELVDDELEDSTSLRNAFIQHKTNPDLFGEPGYFKRVSN